MSILKLESKDYTKMLWKNGQGSTLEIDKGQGWRVSIATVNQDGAFSKFEGMQRIISMIDGDAIQLISSQQEDVVIRTFESHAFSGDEDIYCKVHGRGGQDLNLIYDPTQVNTRFEHVVLNSSGMQVFTDAEALLIFNPTTTLVQINLMNQVFKLNHHETLKVTQPKNNCMMHLSFISNQVSHLYLIEVSQSL